jgi:hypothetical protein
MRQFFLQTCLLTFIAGAAFFARAEEKPAAAEKLVAPKPARKTPEQLAAEQTRRLEAQNTQWNALPVEDRTRVLQLYMDLQQLPKEEHKIIRDRINQYLRMTRGERKQLEENYERWAKMPPAEREKARQTYLRLRWEYETKWRKEHPGQEPPPFKLNKPTPEVAAGPPTVTTNQTTRPAGPRSPLPQ